MGLRRFVRGLADRIENDRVRTILYATQVEPGSDEYLTDDGRTLTGADLDELQDKHFLIIGLRGEAERIRRHGQT